MTTRLNTELAPTAIGPYVQGVVTDAFVITSGQLPIIQPLGISPKRSPFSP